jgi:hypothetical protein
MITVRWPSFAGSHEEDCFDAWYEDLFDRKFNYAELQALRRDEYNNIVAKDLTKYRATIKNTRLTFDITFENQSDYVFFLLKWS